VIDLIAVAAAPVLLWIAQQYPPADGTWARRQHLLHKRPCRLARQAGAPLSGQSLSRADFQV